MTKIFIEAKSNNTPEYHFLRAIINLFFPHSDVTFIFMDGIGNLFNEAILNQIKQAQESGERTVVIADADTVSKGAGYINRKNDIENGMKTHNVSFRFFLYPDNQSDGDVEMLMESAARRDLHSVFFDCFEDYEHCVSGVKDESGAPIYNTPNLKGKLHTYVSAQKLPRKQRNRLGSGDWLFDDINYWDLSNDRLQALKAFFTANI